MRKEYWLLISIIVVIALWYLTPYLVNWLAPIDGDAIAARGQFGDMYGFITSLFSGLTIIGLVYTIIQQQDDLRIAREAYNQQRIDAQTNIEALNLARQEMELTKTAVEQSANELKNQSLQLAYQRFDTTFFNMLRSQRDIVKEIDLKTFRKDKETGKRKVVRTTVGRECFKSFYNQHFKDSIGKVIERKGGNFEWEEDFIYGKLDLDEVIEAYQIFFEKFQNDLSHYFRHLYHIAIRIDQAKFLSREQKLNYAGVIRAQLSTYERLLLFYNGLSPYGIQLKHLINKYQLLKGIPTNLLINRTLDKYDNFGYGLSAYDESETDDDSDVDYADDLV